MQHCVLVLVLVLVRVPVLIVLDCRDIDSLRFWMMDEDLLTVVFLWSLWIDFWIVRQANAKMS